jgi:hypothetical protein
VSRDPKDTKAYNHKPIGNGKPVISNEFFKAAIELIDEGRRDLIEIVENNYALDDMQQQILNRRKA